MSKILCVFPNDPSTRFLEKLSWELNKHFDSNFHCFKVKPNKSSHTKCLDRIKMGNDELILFLGHGQSDKLFGAITNNFNTFHTDSEDFFIHDDFINKENINVFSNKKVICLSCNSNDKIGKWAVDSGTKVFLGFGDIPTDWLTEYERLKISKFDVFAFRCLMRDIILKSIIYVGAHNMTFKALDKVIKIFVNRTIYYGKYPYKIKNLSWVNDRLCYFKDEIKVYGDKDLNIFE